MRIAIAILMALHGVAHTPGFAASWRLAVLQELPYHTALFGGRLEVGDAGMRVMGALWLLTGVGFVGVALAAFAGRPWWTPAAMTLACISLLLCAAEFPAARFGIAVNMVLLLWLAATGLAPSARLTP